jgi:hypothetical protein
MPDFLADFEWKRDAKGYELRNSIFEPTNLPGIFKKPTGNPTLVVRRMGGKFVRTRPLQKSGDLYRAFASIKTDDDVLKFYSRFGALTESGNSEQSGDSVPWVLRWAERFRDWIYNPTDRKKLVASFGPDGEPIAGLLASLVIDNQTGALRLKIVPSDLIQALLIQVAQKLAGRVRISPCLYCNELFEAGPGTGRRLDALFCSPEHQVRFNSHKRSKRT